MKSSSSTAASVKPRPPMPDPPPPSLPPPVLHNLRQMELDDAIVVNLESGKVCMNETALMDASRFPWRERLFEQMTRVLEAMDRCNGPGGSGSGHGPLDGAREQDTEVPLPMRVLLHAPSR